MLRSKSSKTEKVKKYKYCVTFNSYTLLVKCFDVFERIRPYLMLTKGAII